MASRGDGTAENRVAVTARDGTTHGDETTENRVAVTAGDGTSGER